MKHGTQRMENSDGTTERVYCSDLARQSQAELEGSAVQVDLWLLLEYPRPWKPNALTDNDLPAGTRRHLESLPDRVAALSGQRLRVQFVKQASSAEVVHPRVFLADCHGQTRRLVAGTLATYNEIAELEPAQLVSMSLPQATVHHEEMYLVCTNGQRDLCCARYGLPLFEALRLEVGSRVWQTTHVGGHRYAPNLVCLPSGVVYGFVDADLGASLVRDHDAGRLAVANLRGTSAYPPLAQAGEFHLRRRLGLTGFTDCHLVRAEDDSATFAVGDAGVYRVTLRRHVDATQIIASCGAEPKSVERFELLEIAPGSAAEVG